MGDQVTDMPPARWSLELRGCHLVIASSRMMGAGWDEVRDELRERHPGLALLCILDAAEPVPPSGSGSGTPVATLREPFTVEQLRAAVRPLLPVLAAGSVLARPPVRLGMEAGDCRSHPALRSPLHDSRPFVNRLPGSGCVTGIAAARPADC
jgi:hypothetical protein